ncbi:hypothetical protein AGMMS50218_06450 [Actinomycetota bacterium]|nr:hypothetical protein AGMMS50218_06450 [Actinomycetota bacterium]
MQLGVGGLLERVGPGVVGPVLPTRLTAGLTTRLPTWRTAGLTVRLLAGPTALPSAPEETHAGTLPACPAGGTGGSAPAGGATSGTTCPGPPAGHGRAAQG